MRIGHNPEKQNTEISTPNIHRIIIPVYVPNLTEAYFKDGLEILNLCLESILKTIHSKTRISIINNGCCKEVSYYLKEKYETEVAIDELFLSKHNLGKINALYSVIKSNLEPIITITDADVLFLQGWQQSTEELLNDFPQAGMVAPVPSSVAYDSEYNHSTIYYALFKGKLEFTKVLNPEGLLTFQKSIDREIYNQYHLEKYLTVSNNKNKAVIGCGHFVATFRAEVFENAPPKICKSKIVGGSENKYLDIPNDKGGYLRLATLDNYAFHMGNVKEDWMQTELNKLTVNNTDGFLKSISEARPLSKYQYSVGKILHKLLFKKFKRPYFKYKGLSKEAAQHY